jgi:hypothetical protein
MVLQPIDWEGLGEFQSDPWRDDPEEPRRDDLECGAQPPSSHGGEDEMSTRDRWLVGSSLLFSILAVILGNEPHHFPAVYWVAFGYANWPNPIHNAAMLQC